MKIMWNLEDIWWAGKAKEMKFINNKWVVARPENFTKKHTPFWLRIQRAWLVFAGKADCFMWPENQ